MDHGHSKTTFIQKVLPVLVVFLLIAFAFWAGHSNLDPFRAYDFFYVPIFLAGLIWKFGPRKHLDKIGSPAFSMIILTIIGFIFLPLGNRLYVKKRFSFNDLKVTGFDQNEGMVSRRNFSSTPTAALVGHLLVIENPFDVDTYDNQQLQEKYPDLRGSIKVPVSRSEYKECQSNSCSVNLRFNLGLMDTFYLDDIEINLKRPHQSP